LDIFQSGFYGQVSYLDYKNLEKFPLRDFRGIWEDKIYVWKKKFDEKTILEVPFDLIGNISFTLLFNLIKFNYSHFF
jgi:hypothetical protein